MVGVGDRRITAGTGEGICESCYQVASGLWGRKQKL